MRGHSKRGAGESFSHNNYNSMRKYTLSCINKCGQMCWNSSSFLTAALTEQSSFSYVTIFTIKLNACIARGVLQWRAPTSDMPLTWYQGGVPSLRELVPAAPPNPPGQEVNNPSVNGYITYFLHRNPTIVCFINTTRRVGSSRAIPGAMLRAVQGK